MAAAALLAVLAAASATPVRGPHAAAVAGHPVPPADGALRAPAPPVALAARPPQATVYGYWPYWGSDLAALRYDVLSHLAILGVELEADGGLDHTSVWTDAAPVAVPLAHAAGCKVHLCIYSFDPDDMDAALADPSARARTVAALAGLVTDYGADGVNVDYEGVPHARKADFVAFVEELRAATGEVVLAMPAVDWEGAYDYDRLALASDALFVMGYGYHWDGGDPGPLSPLESGDLWPRWNLAWTLDDYRSHGAPDGRIVVGLPLYGDWWPSTDDAIPGTATGEADAVTYAEAVVLAAASGRRWEPVSHTPYTFPSSDSQLWYDDAESLADKIAWALDEGVQGFGFWACGYDGGDPALWDLFAGLAATSPDDTGETTRPDTGPHDTGHGDGTIPAGPRFHGTGCGCGAASPHPILGLLGVLAIRRRRRG